MEEIKKRIEGPARNRGAFDFWDNDSSVLFGFTPGTWPFSPTSASVDLLEVPMRFHRWIAGFFVPVAALVMMPLGCGAAQEEYTEVRHAQESSAESQPEHWLASEAITEELRGCVKQHAHELKKYSHQAKFDISITEEGAVKDIAMRSSTLRHAGLESCLTGVLKNVSVPSSMLNLRSSGPVSGGEASRDARSSVGVVQVAGAAVALGPIVIIAAGVTLGVYILAVATEETIEAVKRKRKVDLACEAAYDVCISYPFQPEWNINRFGERKPCADCRETCRNWNGVWPVIKYPPPGLHRPPGYPPN